MRLYIFIDAFGSEILQKHPNFLKDLIVDRRKIRTIFGYSSACDPSIISGKLPMEHQLWSSFYYSPETCPYKWVKWLTFLPSCLTNRSRVRHLLSKWIKKIHGFTGYFQIYNVPFKYLPFFDYAEKERIWAEGGMGKTRTIFDLLAKMKIPYYVGDQDSETQQITKVVELMEKGSIEFAYLLFGKLDALMHSVGTHDPRVAEQIKIYDQQIRYLFRVASENYTELDWAIFSDHGMHDVTETYDLQEVVSSLNLKYGVDYVAMYDSTMARFWFLNDQARNIIAELLMNDSKGRLLTREELIEFGVYFSSSKYGELIFLVNPGILIIPSFMGLKRIAGMHGYHPAEAASYAMLCSNKNIPDEVDRCEKIFNVMRKSVDA